MCTPKPDLPSDESLVILPDEDLLIALGHNPNLQCFYLSTGVCKKHGIKQRGVRIIKTCDFAGNAIFQLAAKSTRQAGSIREDLSNEDWELLSITLCWNGRFQQPASKIPLILITGEENIATIAQRQQLTVHEIRSQRRPWRVISTPQGVESFLQMRRNNTLPFSFP
ncbi:hypothetical protein HY605_02510 [Candidatus Peregrinibacteria bacterium]|nr:hypothetical protein [Candidatus Peregrinibacteria bacterium]